MHISKGSMYPLGHKRRELYLIPRFGFLFGKPWLVWLNRFWWLV